MMTRTSLLAWLGTCLHVAYTYIRESVDSLCGDGADTPSLNKCNGSELSNAAALNPFRNITWPTHVLDTITLSNAVL